MKVIRDDNEAKVWIGDVGTNGNITVRKDQYGYFVSIHKKEKFFTEVETLRFWLTPRLKTDYPLPEESEVLNYAKKIENILK